MNVRTQAMMTRSGTGSNRYDARYEIASAVCDLVAAGGLDNVSLRRIAKHLGSTTGFISHYYDDKDDLLEAALLAALDELTMASPGATATLDEWLEIAVEGLPRNGNSQRFWRVLTAFQAASLGSVRLSEVLQNYASDREENLVRNLADLVPRESSSSELTALAHSIRIFVAGIGTTSEITPEAFSVDQQRAVLRAGVHGLIEEFIGRQRTT